MSLRGLFGSVGRAMGMGAAPKPATGGYGGIGPGMDGAPLGGRTQAPRQPFMTPERRENWTAKAYDVGSIMQGQAPNRMQELTASREAQRKEAEDRERMGQLQGMARELFPDNPRAQLAFALDPKAFGGVLTEGLKPQTRESGKVYVDPLTGEREGMARIDQFGDRYGFVDPETLESGFGAPRGPTYAEETGRRGQEATAAIGMGNLGVAQGNLGMRRREFDRGPASGGGAGGGLSGMSTEELLRMLGPQ